MKKNLLILALAIVGIGGYFLYQKGEKANSAIANFVPDNTLILLETNELNTSNKGIVSEFPLLSNTASEFKVFEKLGMSSKEITRLINKKVLYFAVLPEGRDNLAIVNYLPLNNDNQDFIEVLGELNQNTKGKRIIAHTTKGYKVSEVIDENANRLFAFIIQDDFLVFSSSSLALEEVVLHQEKNWAKSLIFSNIDIDSVFTKTHFNNTAIGRFVSDISDEKVKSLAYFPSILNNTFIWQKPSKNVVEAISVEGNQIFNKQETHPIECLNLIPNACSSIINLSFSDNKRLTENLESELKKNKVLNKLRDKISNSFNVDFGDIYTQIDNEITLCSFDNFEQSTQNKVLIIKQKQLVTPLKIIAKNVAEQQEDDVFSVQYGSFLITSLGIKEFPSTLLGGIFGGFSECYFTQYNDYVILASSLPVMQEYLINVSKGDVWSNSPKNKTILKQCPNANLTFIAESEKSLKGLGQALNTKWQNKVAEHTPALMGIQAVVIQQNAYDSRMALLKNIAPVKTSQKYTNKWVKLGSMGIVGANEPLYLINPANKKTETLVQGNNKHLYLFEGKKKIWEAGIDGMIIGKIKTVKFNDVSKQQLLVVTNTKFYVLTRNEKGFEMIVSKKYKPLNIESFNIFENEINRNESLMLVATNGESFKIDKKSLELTPVYSKKQLSETLSPMPSVMIKGVEYAIVLEKTGKLILQNAQGKLAAGFPLSIAGIFNNSPILEGENNNIVLRMVSEKGELYKISLGGKILEKKQLFRPDNEVKFAMSADERNTDWVIMRTNGKEVIVLDKLENELFTVKDLNYGRKVLKYYNLGTAGKYFAVNNGYTTYRFYNSRGENIGGNPMESQTPPSLTYSDSYKKIIVNITTPSGLETWSVKIQ